MAFLKLPKREYSYIDEEPKGNDEFALVDMNHRYRAISGCRLTVYAFILALLTSVLGFWAGKHISHLDTAGLIEGNKHANISRIAVNG